MEKSRSKNYKVRYVDTEAVLLQTGSLLDENDGWGKGVG